MELFLREALERIGADDVLAKIDALVDWRVLLCSFVKFFSR